MTTLARPDKQSINHCVCLNQWMDDKNGVISEGKLDVQLELILTTHLYKDFAPLLDDVGLMFQVVFGGLTDVYLHALLRQNRTQKTDAKAKY